MVLETSSSVPLNISIVGAGIGGLAAAIALRRNGHHVKIFEASETKTEVGAGLGVQPNAWNILEQFGCVRENLKPSNWDGTVVFDAKNGVGITRPFLVSQGDETKNSVFCHRSDLHEELRRLAVDESETRFPPIKFHLDTKVVACNPDLGTVTLASGESIPADVVIGADGIHSVIRTSVIGHVVKAPATGWTCFRCLFDASNLDGSEGLEWLTEGLTGARSVILREQDLRMFFIYPCRKGTLINFVGIHPDPDQEAAGWTATATIDDVRTKFSSFNSKFLRLLDLPLYTPILRWQLRALPILPTWIHGRTALLGDAAHATLPMLGQGAAMAIEEAAVLACLLPLGTTREDIPARLEAYQTLRKERGDFVGTESVKQAAVPAKRGEYLRSREMQATMIGYDALKVGQEYYNANF
ncbi:FAD/NAD(P)-binding domain-containing protein [Favolaschia claudopus]|uniref:FAD/NAD(P)-binding domain-containing protein n=1 Tax=Favolaschia claudopus TaxID=2862362 RepID=A0AAW0ED02_9AGAR